MKKLDEFDTYLFGAGFLILCFVFGSIIGSIIESRNAKEYIPLHKCIIVEFAGENAEPIYQCDTGLKRRRDM